MLKYVLSTALGAVLVWLAFRGEDWGAFREGLGGVDTTQVALYLLLFAAGHFMRIVRWGVLVRALGPVRWRDIVSAGAVGYMCIIVFPLRLGELVRPWLVRGMEGVTASGALATVVVERVIDGLLLVGLFFVFIAILPPSGHPAVAAVRVSAYVAGAVFTTTLVVLIAGYVRREQTVTLIEAIGKRIHRGLTAKALGLLEAFLDGLRVLPDRRRIVLFLGLTVAYWVILGIGMKVMADAVGITEVTYTGAFAVLAVLVVGIMVPGGPGFTGTFELALKGAFALLPLGAASVALVPVYTIVLHALQLAWQVLLGAAFLLAGQVDLRGVLGAAPVSACIDSPDESV